ncbi:MAG: extracellular solute-binding protein, partial [Actinobacteria bacterium]|nr:extracellular solute-binding protein [Actinomycetota bacterium]
MTEALAQGFEEGNGAKVQIRYGEDEGLASQIEQEGDASPADVVLTENTPPLEALAENGLLAKVEPSTLAEVPS